MTQAEECPSLLKEVAADPPDWCQLAMGDAEGMSSSPPFDPAWSSSHEGLCLECDYATTGHPPPPRTHTRAFTELLHGDADEYFIYALVLAGQLHRYSRHADRVLLLGPGQLRESLEARKALSRAGWTHLLGVEAIDIDRHPTFR